MTISRPTSATSRRRARPPESEAAKLRIAPAKRAHVERSRRVCESTCMTAYPRRSALPGHAQQVALFGPGRVQRPAVGVEQRRAAAVGEVYVRGRHDHAALDLADLH